VVIGIARAPTPRMESVAAARTRLHFQSIGTTAGLHDRETKARLVHAFYRSCGVDRITKIGVSKIKNKKVCFAAARLQVRK